jgi:hypothetical protein
VETKEEWKRLERRERGNKIGREAYSQVSRN